MNEPTPDARETVLVALTLLGQTGRGQGARPSARELRDFAQGTLTAERRAEIESHLAHDPDVFQSFMLANRSRRVDASKSIPWRERFFSKWVMAGAAACILAVLGIALTAGMRGPASPAEGHRVARHSPVPATSTTPVRDWRGRAFAYGFENPGTWDRMTGEGLDGLSGHCNGNDCVSEIDAMTDFGVAVAAISARCSESTAPAVPLQGVESAVARLQSLRGKVTDPHWAGALERLIAGAGQPAGRLCGAAQQLAKSAKVSR